MDARSGGLVIDWRSPRWAPWLAAVAAMLVLVVTLAPAGDDAVKDTCALCGPVGADVILNTLLFVPLGAFLVLAGWGPWTTVVAGLVLSVGVEGIQAAVPGRFTSGLDIVFNTAGTGLGVLFARYGGAWLQASGARGRVPALLSGVGIVAVVASTAWLLTPDPPPSVYYGQWTPDLGHLERYEGRVVTARIAGKAVPPERLEEESPALRRLIRERAAVEVSLVAGPPTDGIAPVFSLYDEDQREVFLLGTDRDDVVVRYATRGSRLGFRTPAHRLEGGARSLMPGSVVDLWVAGDGDRGLCIRAESTERCGIGFSAGSGWALLLPESWSRPFSPRTLDAAWLALLGFPIGLWGRRTRYGLAGWMLGVGAVLGAPLMGMQVTAATGPVALTAGVLAGAWAGVGLRARPAEAARPPTPRQPAVG